MEGFPQPPLLCPYIQVGPHVQAGCTECSFLCHIRNLSKTNLSLPSWVAQLVRALSQSRGVQPFGISGPHWKKKSCLGPYIKYIATCNHKKSHNILTKFTILCWATFIAIVSHMQPAGHRLDTPGGYTKVVSSIPGHGTYKSQAMNA